MSRKFYIYMILLGILISFTVSFTYNYYNKPGLVLGDEVEELTLEAAKSAYYEGDLEQAESIYTEIIRNESASIEALRNLIVVKKELGKLEESIPYSLRLINYEPEKTRYKFEAGRIYFQLGNYKEAEMLLLEVFESDNQFSAREKALLYNYLGVINYKNDNMNKAREFFQAGIELYPYISFNYQHLARVYLAENRIEEAISTYNEALKRDSNLSFLYPELAINYEKLADDEAAYYYWQRSFNTGNRRDLAENKIKQLQQKHPEFLEREREEKERERAGIKWPEVEPVKDTADLPVIRVGLIENIEVVTFQAGASFTVMDKESGKKIITGNAREEWKIKINKEGYAFYRDEEVVKKISLNNPLILKMSDNSHTFVFYDINYGQGYFWAGNEDRHYRGEIELFPVSASSFNVINTVNIEEYLFSVVPSEMPAWWPEEALKAQAIAARSYALSHLGKHQGEGFDLCATVHCAVYKGVVSEVSTTNQAVLETSGEVGSFNNRIIDAVFSSNSGGYSESSQAVWGTDISYLIGANNMIDQELDFPLEPFQLNRWLIDEPASYSSIPGYAGYNTYRWVKLLPDTFFLDEFNLKSLTNIIPLTRSKGGNIEEVLIIGKDKQITVKKDRIRSKLGGLKSNRFIIEKRYREDGSIAQIIFFGSGWGHNVGMDQTAAAGMADNGFTYQDIIKHFYKGSIIKKLY